MDIMASIAAKRIVPVAALEDEDCAEPLAQALLDAGLDVMEVTFRSAAALPSMHRISVRFPGMVLGAGTVMEISQLRAAVRAGARFAVAPGLNECVVAAAREAGVEMIPGIMTPSEIERAMSLGCRVLKFFPAEQAGGTAMLKAFEGPYGHTGVKFIPTGGVGPSNLRSYLQRPSVLAVGGSWMVDRKLIAARDWTKIAELTREALALAAQKD